MQTAHHLDCYMYSEISKKKVKFQIAKAQFCIFLFIFCCERNVILMDFLHFFADFRTHCTQLQWRGFWGVKVRSLNISVFFNNNLPWRLDGKAQGSIFELNKTKQKALATYLRVRSTINNNMAFSKNKWIVARPDLLGAKQQRGHCHHSSSRHRFAVIYFCFRKVLSGYENKYALFTFPMYSLSL